jgi:hypothetical protein
MIAAFVRNHAELVGTTNELAIGLAVIAAGVVLYFVGRIIRGKRGV